MCRGANATIERHTPGGLVLLVRRIGLCYRRAESKPRRAGHEKGFRCPPDCRLDGPTVYLAFQLIDLAAIPKTVDLLRRTLNATRAADQAPHDQGDEGLILGCFGSSSVSIMQDDEDLSRCFLVIDSGAVSAMRLTLQQDDIESLLEALRQVAEDLPEQAK